MAWYGMVCYGMLWYAMVCYGMIWFTSTEKIIRTTKDDKRNTRVLDIECSFIETTRIGSIEGGTKVLDIVNGDSSENTNLKYIKLESNVSKSILVNIADSITKRSINITRKPYVTVQFRPRLCSLLFEKTC